MMIEFLFLLSAYVSFMSGNAQATDGYATDSPKNVFILAGQSNMAGRGGVIDGIWDGIIPPECKSNPFIRRLSANLSWEEATEPLHRDIDVNKTCGIGPGMAFANSVLQGDPSSGYIGLVPCAVGGTNISQWARGTDLYNQLIRRARAAVQSGGIIRALLWYQGESDTVSFEDARRYKSNLQRFLTDVRSGLQSPILPVFQVALASGEGPYVEIVRQAQLGAELPNVRCVDAKGLELQPDNLHLTAQAQVQLGEMLADAFFQTPPYPLPRNSTKA
ncbi:probable carbohydrate esterase At4g34215 [Coffea arabica]|uniref:Probable carbohydrate esterase At4g34215 n=1 Tax=Coffea arabica TaxID=13443 RepID=A0A6P6UNG7_COFAR|nr:probable carbohydrate esterase At4g34215 [Coffea arabica]